MAEAWKVKDCDCSGPERTNFRPVRDYRRPERAYLRIDTADLGPMKADLGPLRANFRPEKAILRKSLEGRQTAGKERRTYRRIIRGMDVRKFTPVFCSTLIL